MIYSGGTDLPGCCHPALHPTTEGMEPVRSSRDAPRDDVSLRRKRGHRYETVLDRFSSLKPPSPTSNRRGQLTFEEFSTLTAQIEACLNSRPISPLSVPTLKMVAALTPGHFLIGTALLAAPEPATDDERLVGVPRWKIATQMRNHFWRRWQREVLNHMQVRQKWNIRQPGLLSGELVLITDDLQPPQRWPLARVEQLHPGADGLTRVVTLRTANTSLKRPITKKMWSCTIITCMLLTAIVNEATAEYGYDCGAELTNVTTISLVDVGKCEKSRPELKNNTIRAQLVQLNDYGIATVKECRILIKRSVFYCGMLSHIAAVANEEVQYYKEITRDECDQLHATGSYVHQNLVINDIPRNGSITTPHTFAGTTAEYGRCTGESRYVDAYGTFHDDNLTDTIGIKSVVKLMNKADNDRAFYGYASGDWACVRPVALPPPPQHLWRITNTCEVSRVGHSPLRGRNQQCDSRAQSSLPWSWIGCVHTYYQYANGLASSPYACPPHRALVIAGARSRDEDHGPSAFHRRTPARPPRCRPRNFSRLSSRTPFWHRRRRR
ncbi:unnamed protein product, partial [Trichogramma brassicae]